MAQQVKDLVWSLLWWGFDPWPGNSHVEGTGKKPLNDKNWGKAFEEMFLTVEERTSKGKKKDKNGRQEARRNRRQHRTKPHGHGIGTGGERAPVTHTGHPRASGQQRKRPKCAEETHSRQRLHLQRRLSHSWRGARQDDSRAAAGALSRHGGF